MEAERLKPTKRMRCQVRKSAEPQSSCHESQILEHSSLLDSSKLIQPRVEEAHCRRTAFYQIVVQVASL